MRHNYDTPLTVEHETEVLHSAGFSDVRVMKKWRFLYATNEGAFFRMRSGKGAVLTKAPNVCGLKYLPDENMIQVFLFKDLRQYEYNQHHDTCGYMYEEWRNSYHTDVEIKSYNYDGIVRQLS